MCAGIHKASHDMGIMQKRMWYR